MQTVKKTKFFNTEERKWVLVDAKDKVLGRLSTRIANILQGKNKPTYSPNFLCGDKVVVVNAKYIKVTGKKMNEKVYDRFSGYPDGRRQIVLKDLIAKNPCLALYISVRGMLPKNLLRKRMLRALKIYPENTHSQQAQKPVEITV